MMKPRVQVDDRLVLLVESQEGGEPLNLLWGDMRGIQRLNAPAEIVLLDLLSETGVVHGHVDS